MFLDIISLSLSHTHIHCRIIQVQGGGKVSLVPEHHWIPTSSISSAAMSLGVAMDLG